MCVGGWEGRGVNIMIMIRGGIVFGLRKVGGQGG